LDLVAWFFIFGVLFELWVAFFVQEALTTVDNRGCFLILFLFFFETTAKSLFPERVETPDSSVALVRAILTVSGVLWLPTGNDINDSSTAMAKRIGLLFFLFFVTTTKNCSHMKDDARTELAQRTWVANKGRSFGQKRRLVVYAVAGGFCPATELTT
jgi:hypothetical protein